MAPNDPKDKANADEVGARFTPRLRPNSVVGMGERSTTGALAKRSVEGACAVEIETPIRPKLNPPKPSPRLDIEVLLKGTSLNAAMRRAVVDALEERALLFGSKAPPDMPPDANGRLCTIKWGPARPPWTRGRGRRVKPRGLPMRSRADSKKGREKFR